MFEVNTNMFRYDKTDKTFSQDISSLQIGVAPFEIALTSQWTNQVYHFARFKIDMEGPAHEQEIGGWWYKSTGTDTSLKILIIND